jgi:hypothetical protein
MILTNKQIEDFGNKQGIALTSAKDGLNGGLYCWSNLRALHGRDVLYDIETGQPTGRIIDWIDEEVDRAIDGIEPSQSYKDYCDGFQE